MRVPVKKEIRKPGLLKYRPIPRERSPDNLSVLTATEILNLRANGKISREEGLTLFQRYVDAAFPNEVLVELLSDQVQATDTKHAPGEGFYKSENWDARDKALKLILQLKKVAPDYDMMNRPPSQKIYFNVVPSKPRPT